MVDLREYQQRIVDRTVALFQGREPECENPPARSVLVQSPTGSGKTVLGLCIAKTLQRITDCRVGWVALRYLLEQAAAENRDLGINVEPIHFISMFDRNPPTDIDLLVVDECQHDAASSMAHLHNLIEPKMTLGLTATPFRADLMRLCFDHVIRDTGIEELIQAGFLSTFDHFTIPRWSVQTVTDAFCREPERWGQSIMFFHSLADCAAACHQLRSQGISCDTVTGTSDRTTQLAAFKRGDIQVLANCFVLTEGLNVPRLDSVFVRPSTRSATVQMGGRVLRTHPDVPIKQIVQCQTTRCPFPCVAQPRNQFVWNSSAEDWQTVRPNPAIGNVLFNARQVTARTEVSLPRYILTHRERQRRRVGAL